MFWTRITKGFLKVQVAIGIIMSLGGAIATRSLAGIGVFIGGIVVTFAMSCVLGTFCEISEGVAKLSNQIVGQSASDRELNKRLNSIENSMERMMSTAKKQGSAAVKRTAEKIANSIPDRAADIDRPLNYPAENEFDNTMTYNEDDGETGPLDDSMNKTTTLPMDVIMEKVNNSKPQGDAGITCVVCGSKNKVGAAFCFNCGSKL